MKIDAIDIRNIIRENQDNIAFIIGNGIHYQYKDCNLPWMNLLKSLWKEYFGEEKEVPEGISTTEFFDVLEMNFYNKSESSLEKLKKICNQARLKDLGIKSKDIDTIIFNLAQKSPKIRLDNINRDLIDSFQESHNAFVSSCRKWCNENMEDSVEMSDDACTNQVFETLINDTKKKILANNIKRTVAKKFPPKDAYNLERCVNAIMLINAPILTTNFDTYISDSVGATQRILRQGQYKFTDFYPWNMYHSNKELNSPLEDFAVWHINGVKSHPRSIKLGLSDYMGCVERARRMIQGQNLNEYFDGKYQMNWKGYNTWLHIIFNKDLFIFGLKLEENEVFLRWLLIQRAKYCKMYNKPLKGWYIGMKDKDIKKGKRFFLEQLGIQVIEIDNYNMLYQALETCNEIQI